MLLIFEVKSSNNDVSLLFFASSESIVSFIYLLNKLFFVFILFYCFKYYRNLFDIFYSAFPAFSFFFCVLFLVLLSPSLLGIKRILVSFSFLTTNDGILII